MTLIGVWRSKWQKAMVKVRNRLRSKELPPRSDGLYLLRCSQAGKRLRQARNEAILKPDVSEPSSAPERCSQKSNQNRQFKGDTSRVSEIAKK